ncbi:MAG: protein kinase, partial [Pseudomonadota bacterium]
VAIKVLSPQLAKKGEALRALQQEAAKGRCLVHPNIVRFIDLDREDDLYFIVMEWLEGRTLADILDSDDRTSIDNDAAFRIVRQVGDALEYAHRCGIVHADVKPGNIMIMPNGDAKLFDFGVARVQQRQDDDGFNPGVLGAMTPAYSSMQVLTGEEPVASDDVFSLACLLYRLVAGYRVFGPRNAAEASQAAMKPQQVNGFSDSQWSALKKALSYSRVTRFESIAEFMDALHDRSPDTISIEAPQRFVETDERGPGRWLGLLALLAIAVGIGAWQQGYLDRWLTPYIGDTARATRIRDNDTPALPEPAVEVPVLAVEPTVVNEESVADVERAPAAEAAEETLNEAPGESVDLGEDVPEAAQPDDVNAVGPASPLIDFSTLPEPTLVVSLAGYGADPDPVTFTIRENADPAIIDLVRDSDLSTELTVRLEEVGFSGNRSPWAGGQYALSNSGLVKFPVGQSRGRVTLTMAQDSMNESDQQSILRVRAIDLPGSELAVINVMLEDDDRRAFEASLPTNTIAFSISQTAISEKDPAVQLDLVRLNPDDTAVVASFTLEDITATEGEDYFAPGAMQVSFGPRQRTARLLIPLVQDALSEGDEAFVVTLDQGDDISPTITRNVLVRILDDEPQISE